MQEEVAQEITSVENSLESALKLLWERAYAASAAIAALREEKNAIQLRANDLESRVLQMEKEASARNDEIERLQRELDRITLASASNGMLDKEERVRLQERVKAILDKINSHL
ncbi:MAG TPA: hypothetical protein VMG34_05865 [Bacteroidota bacterium]|nr:hypothetical protein [Bacteroidota bacterium]